MPRSIRFGFDCKELIFKNSVFNSDYVKASTVSVCLFFRHQN